MLPTIYVKHHLSNIFNIPQIISMHYFELDKNFSFQGELHDFWEMVYIDKGEVNITADTRTFSMRQGEMIFHKPNEFHSICANGICAPNVLILAFECRSRAMSFFREKRLLLPENLRNLLAQIINEGNQAYTLHDFHPARTDYLLARKDAQVGAQQMIRIYLEQLLICLLRENAPSSKDRLMFSTKESYDNHIVTVMVDLLEKHLYQTISVEEICRRLGYGKTYLSTLFKQATGSSIKEYSTMVKITEAKRLIREHNHTVEEISQLLAFDTPQYFSRRFKQYTGMSPREYANSVPLK